jgi:pilus assembly protein Flp/PilA
MLTTLQMLSAFARARLSVARDEKGATAVEYGIMVALIAAVIIAIVATLGLELKEAFTDVWTALNGRGSAGK